MRPLNSENWENYPELEGPFESNELVDKEMEFFRLFAKDVQQNSKQNEAWASETATASQTASGGSVSAPAPPAEGPYAGITGQTCASGNGKCWRGAKSRDITDGDVPWNNALSRSPKKYDAVLDYFNVGNSKGIDGSAGPENPRYLGGGGATYCNIYVHDVTRAMWASIPHWVRDPRQTQRPVGWNELSANRTVAWMHSNAQSIGWILIDAALSKWIFDQFTQKRSLPFGGPSLPSRIQSAGGKIAGAVHDRPGLFAQAGYDSQQFANLGLPTVMVWKNPNPKRHGHMAMVRPETPSKRGIVDKSGQFRPRSAQAGARNFTNQPMDLRRTRTGLFYVHE